MNEVRTYRDLLVWQKAVRFVTEIYRSTRGFPREEIYGLTAQIRRCAVSIPSNIAEGYGRHSTNDYLRFLNVAVGSLYELQTQIEISQNLSYLPQTVHNNLFEQTRELERMLTSLRTKIAKTKRKTSNL